jgi:F-type H+-transporting ATPase subunit 8
MPQLVPFFFVNQVIFGFIILSLLTYLLSKYILPEFVRVSGLRSYIKTL